MCPVTNQVKVHATVLNCFDSFGDNLHFFQRGAYRLTKQPKYRKEHSNVFEWRLIIPDPRVFNSNWLFFIWCSSWLFLQIIFLSMWFHSLLSNYFQQVDQESLGQKVQDGIRTLAFRGYFSHFCMILSL